MKHISSSSRSFRTNPCQFYRKNAQDCWVGHKYIPCNQLEQHLLEMAEPCLNIMSPAIMTTTTTAPQMTTQLSATSPFDFNSPAIILIFILIITLLATLIVFSITVIVIHFLGHCRNSDRSAHYTSKSTQTRRLLQQEEQDTIHLTPLIRQVPDRVPGFDRPAFDRNQNLPQHQILDNPHISLVSSTTPQRIRHTITNASETCHNDFHIGYLCEPARITKLPDERPLRKVETIVVAISIELTPSHPPSNCFAYNNKYYRQIRGGAMGSAFTQVLANIYMFEWEQDLIEHQRLHHGMYGR
ncbi:unnamed protein product [Adineta ricciae]|nr:unnamed protein product [Adineta ricciae]